MSEQQTSKKKVARLRTVSMWVTYDPARQKIVSLGKFKYEVPELPGHHVFQMKGHYVPVRK